jgi:hypothetical protein
LTVSVPATVNVRRVTAPRVPLNTDTDCVLPAFKGRSGSSAPVTLSSSTPAGTATSTGAEVTPWGVGRAAVPVTRPFA